MQLYTIGLGTSWQRGDIVFGGGMIWTTMPKVPLSLVDGALRSYIGQWVWGRVETRWELATELYG